MNQCRICGEPLISETANYCSEGCRQLDSRLFFSKYTLIFVTLLLLSFVIIAISVSIPIIYSSLIFTATILIVLLPLYQFYKASVFERKLKISYRRQSSLEEQEGQPVYIYRYINRYAERTIHDEDYSEFT